ncbi:hypothetical protein [Kitasatospora indigofera]|uniref:hypothetical protein n=1 Tax=Kitasatospora indigofera TaxID=67307 RepID=UPI00369EAD87
MTTPPAVETTDEHVTLLANLHAVITQAIEDTPYVLGTPVGPFAAVITAEVAAYMGKQVTGVVAELNAGRNTAPAEPIRDELSRHLDWSFWGTGMADTFREPLAESMLAGITPEQRQQANDLITRWRDHREFVGRDLYEAQKAELDAARAELAATVEAGHLLAEQVRNHAAESDRLREQLAAARNDVLTEAGALLLHKRGFLNDVADPAEQAAALLLASCT